MEECISIPALLENFEVLAKNTKPAAPAAAEEETEEPPPFTPKGGCTLAGFKRKASTTEVATVEKDILADDDTALSIATKLVDKGVQMMLFKVRTEESAFEADMADFVADVDKVRAWWSAHCQPMEPEAQITFGSLLSAVLVIAKCCAKEHADKPLPSAVREARQLVIKAALVPSPINLALTMEHSAAAQIAMERSRVEAATGIQDQLSDDQFNQVVDSMEKAMALAYDEGIASFALTGPSEEQHTMSGYMELFTICERATIELQQCLAQWSMSRLEEQCEDIAAAIHSVQTACQVASWVACQSSEVFLATLVDMLPEEPSDAVAEAALALATDQVAEQPDDAGVAQEALDASPVPKAASPTAAPLAPIAKVDFAALAKEVPPLQYELEPFLARLAELARKSKTVIESFVTKLGSKFEEELNKLGVDANGTLEDAEFNQELLTKWCAYIADACAISEMQPLAIGDLDGASNDREEYMQLLASFCSNHKFMTNDFQIRLCSECDNIRGALVLPVAVNIFLTQSGEPLFQQHTGPTIHALAHHVVANSVVMNPVATETVAASANTSGLFQILVKTPSSEELSASLFVLSDGKPCLKAFLSHEQALENLEALIDKLEIPTLPIDGLQLAGSAPSTTASIPASRGLTFAKTLAMTRSIACYAAALHEHMLVGEVPKVSGNKDLLLGCMPSAAAAYGRELARLDFFLESAEVKDMEREGWHSSFNFSTVRVWRQNMSSLRGRLLQTLLEFWADLLDSASNEASSACPSLQAAISDGQFDESVALNLMSGRKAKVAKAYNSLYDLLADLRNAAVQVNLSPPLKMQEATKSSLVLAMHSLSATKCAMTMIRGCELLSSVRLQPDGPQQVADFIARTPAEEKGGISPCFWAHLDAFAKEASPLRTSAGSQSSRAGVGGSGMSAKDEAKSEIDKEDGDSTIEVGAKAVALATVGPPKLKRRRR